MAVSKDIRFRSALEDHDNQKFLQAIRKLEELEVHFPDNWLIKYNKGNSKFEEGKRTNNRKLVKNSLVDFQHAKKLSEENKDEGLQYIDENIASVEAYLKLIN